MPSFFFSSLLFGRKKVLGWLFSWAAPRHSLFLHRPVSRCAFGREGVNPDLPLPGWEATGRHSRAGVGEELAEMFLSSGWSMWSG